MIAQPLVDDQPVISPEILAIHLTYQCPLQCAHCCFSSNMYRLGHLSESQVLQAIDQAATLSSIRAIGFTGGDPLLQRDILLAGIRRAHEHHLRTRVVTSAYWAVSKKKAAAVTDALSQAGLDELTISYDDAHANFVREDCIVAAYRAARHSGLFTVVTICLDPGCTIDRCYIERLLGATSDDPEAKLLIFESKVTTVGRAVETSTEEVKARRRAGTDRYLGPCPYVLRQPTLTPDGRMLACCGTIPFRKGLQIAEAGASIPAAVARAYANPVLKWIAFEGPIAVLEQITRGTDQPLVQSDFDGICQACDTLFSEEKYADLLAEALPGKLASLALQEAVYSAAGVFSPGGRLPEPEER